MPRALDRRPAPHWRCDLVRVGSAWQLSLAGELDLAALPELRQAAGPVLDGPAGCRVCVDLCPVAFMDCTPVGWLLRFAAAVRRRGGTVVVLVRPGSQPEDLLRRLGLHASLGVAAG